MNTVEVLKAARAEVEKGWCKGRFDDVDGNVCTLGALCRGARVVGTLATLPALTEVRKHVPEGFGGSVICFNDDPATTKQDVLNLFDKALADLGGLA